MKDVFLKLGTSTWGRQANIILLRILRLNYHREKRIFLISGTIVSHFQHRGAVTFNILSNCSWQMFQTFVFKIASFKRWHWPQPKQKHEEDDTVNWTVDAKAPTWLVSAGSQHGSGPPPWPRCEGWTSHPWTTNNPYHVLRLSICKGYKSNCI